MRVMINSNRLRIRTDQDGAPWRFEHMPETRDTGTHKQNHCQNILVVAFQRCEGAPTYRKLALEKLPTCSKNLLLKETYVRIGSHRYSMYSFCYSNCCVIFLFGTPSPSHSSRHLVGPHKDGCQLPSSEANELGSAPLPPSTLEVSAAALFVAPTPDPNVLTTNPGGCKPTFSHLPACFLLMC